MRQEFAKSVRRVVLLFATAAGLSGCWLVDLLAPPASVPPDPVWDPVGSVRTRFLAQLPTSNPGELLPSPKWTTDGLVAPSALKQLLMLNPQTGAKRWQTDVGQGMAGAHVVHEDHAVYVATDFGAASVDAVTGSLRWSYATPVDERVSALLGEPGDKAYVGLALLGADAQTLYLPMWGGMTSAINRATGTTRWVWHDTTGDMRPAGVTGVAVSSDTLYWHTWVHQGAHGAPNDKYVYAVRASDATELWRYKLSGTFTGAGPTVVPLVYKNLLIIQEVERVVALNRFTGSVVWTHQESASVTPWSHIAVDGDLVFGTTAEEQDNTHAFALDAATGTVVWRTLIYFGPIRAPAISAQRIYMTDGYFLTVLDKVSGRVVARVTAPSAAGSCAPLSGPTTGAGAMFIRIGCTSGRGPNGWIYTDFIWAIEEP